MKVRIQHGNSCIEVDGDLTEVTEILDKWWTSKISIEPANDQDESDQAPAPAKKRGTRRASPRPAAGTRESVSKINAEDIANRAKEDSRFEQFRQKFILGDASRSDRAKFVSWFVGDTPITSGDVSRVMLALGVKFDPATASRAMSDAPGDWIKDTSGPQTTFRLSSPARHAFEQKVLNAKSAA